MRKKMYILLTALTITCTSHGRIFADEVEHDLLPSDYEYVSSNIDNLTNVVPDEIQTRAVGFHVKETVVSKQTRYWVFCGYAVPTWQKASSYTSNKTYSASTGYTFMGVSTTIGVSKTATATIPANPKKFNRLACYADITFKKVKIERFQGGGSKPVNVSYRVDKIYHDRYLDVAYK